MNFQSKPTPFPAMRGGRARRAGFTLVELLAVVLVISILMTVGVMGVRNLSAGKSTTAAIASIEGLFDEARLLAIGKGTDARVLVDVDDPKKGENYLRRVIIAYRHVDNNGEVSKNWVLANRGYQIPQSVYFSRLLSSRNHAGTSGASGAPLEEEEMRFYVVDNDNEAKAVSGTKTDWNGKYVYYEFNSEGICQSPGASFIVGSGMRRPGADDPMITGGAERDFTGLVVWQNGRTSLFRSPSQMEAGSSELPTMGTPENRKF